MGPWAHAGGRRAAAARRRWPSSKTPLWWKVDAWVGAVPDNAHDPKPILKTLTITRSVVLKIQTISIS